MEDHEILPHSPVGLAEIVFEGDSMDIRIADFMENLHEGALVPWFAVDNDTVHVEDDPPDCSQIRVGESGCFHTKPKQYESDTDFRLSFPASRCV